MKAALVAKSISKRDMMSARSTKPRPHHLHLFDGTPPSSRAKVEQCGLLGGYWLGPLLDSSNLVAAYHPLATRRPQVLQEKSQTRLSTIH